ncbi:MAG: hypothetical protein P1S59_14110 [bacterium]|nr:hypothetical protein [bacterium]
MFNTYFDKLVPRTISYTAALTNYFFRAHMEVTSIPGGITITNSSGEQMNGWFSIYYDSVADDTRAQIPDAAWYLKLSPDETSGTLTVNFPYQEESTYTLAFKGELGQEGKAPFDEHYAVAGQVFTWAPPTSTVTYKLYHTGSNPKGVAISPNGSTLYVGCQDDDTVQVFDTESLSGTPYATIPVGDGPNFLALTPSGKYLFISNEWDKSISVIDTETLSVAQTITGLPSFPQELEVTADGSRLYATSWGWYPVTRVDIAGSPPFNVVRYENYDVHRWGQGLGINNTKSELYAGYNTF